MGRKIVEYNSIKFSWLQSFCDSVLQGDLAQGVEIVVAKKDISGGSGFAVRKGDTIKVLQSSKGSSTFLGGIPWDESTREIAWADVDKKGREAWTTEDVAQYVVKSRCASQECIYIELLGKGSEAVSKYKYQGSFVSQARSCAFVDLVKALKFYYDRAGRDPNKEYVWLDVFCANQPLLSLQAKTRAELKRRKTYENALTHGLHQAIANFDNVLLFLKNWKNPAPLKRAWCIWEVFGVVRAKKSLDVALTEAEFQEVVAYYLKDSLAEADSLNGIIARNINLEQAECFAKRDLLMIHKAIEEESSFLEVHEAVASKIRAFFVSIGVGVINDFLSAKSQTPETLELMPQIWARLPDEPELEENLKFKQKLLALAKQTNFSEYTLLSGVRVTNGPRHAKWLKALAETDALWGVCGAVAGFALKTNDEAYRSESNRLRDQVGEEYSRLFKSFRLDESKDLSDQIKQLKAVQKTHWSHLHPENDRAYFMWLQKRFELAKSLEVAREIQFAMSDLFVFYCKQKNFKNARDIASLGIEYARKNSFGFDSKQHFMFLSLQPAMWAEEFRAKQGPFRSKLQLLQESSRHFEELLSVCLKGYGRGTMYLSSAYDAAQRSFDLASLLQQDRGLSNAVKVHYARAESLLNEAIPLATKHGGPTSIYLKLSLTLLARTYEKQGRQRESRQAWQRALAISKVKDGESSYAYERLLNMWDS